MTSSLVDGEIYILQNKLLQYSHVNEQLCLHLLYRPYLKMSSSEDQLFNFIAEFICVKMPTYQTNMLCTFEEKMLEFKRTRKTLDYTHLGLTH